MNKKLLIATVGAALAGAGNAAHAGDFEARVSGQVNRAVMSADDGASSETHHVDNANSGTRFRFTGEGEISPTLKAGIVWEMEFASNSSNSVTQTAKSSDPTLKERHANVYFQGEFGRISLGQSDGAANDAVKVDLSGTSVINQATTTDIGGAIVFAGGGPKMSAVIGAQNFESRYDRLRYDTPVFGPLTFSVSTGTKENQDVEELAAWYSQDFGAGGKIAAALGYSVKDTESASGDLKTTGGSISWLGTSGVNLTFGTTNAKNDAATPLDGKFTYLKVGYKSGVHAVAVDFARGEDQAADGDNAEMTGIGYVYTAAKWAELYAGAKVVGLDRPGASFEDMKFVTLGTRLKF